MLDFLVQIPQRAHVDSMLLQFEVGQILASGAIEKGALGTLGLSNGTKFVVPRNGSSFAQEIILYVFFVI